MEWWQNDRTLVKELSFAIIKQAFGRFEEQWRYKKRKNEL